MKARIVVVLALALVLGGLLQAAISHLPFDNTNHSQRIRECLNNLERGRNELVAEVSTMELMIDGDGSNVSHFEAVRVKYGFPDTTVAKAAFEELAALKGKLDSDASTSNVKAAMLQAFNKFRN